MSARVRVAAPNSYTLPNMMGGTVQSSKKQAPIFSMRKKLQAKVYDYASDLANVLEPFWALLDWLIEFYVLMWDGKGLGLEIQQKD